MLENKRIQLRFSAYELDRIIVTLINNVSNYKFVNNVKTLFSQFDKESYVHDEEKNVKVVLINKISETILSLNLTDKAVLLNTLELPDKYYNDCVNLLNSLYEQQISDKEAINLDNKISGQLKYAVIDSECETLIDKINTIRSGLSEDTEKDIDSIENSMTIMSKNLKEYNSAIETANNSVSVDGASFLSRIGKLIEKENNPSSTIRTGIKLFNDIIGGGFKAGRVYCCLAPMKNWKSGLLLNAAIWAKKYNNLKPKDPTKKPVVLYLTLENSVDETIVRMISYATGNDYKFSEHTKEENGKILEKAGIFTPNNDNELGIEIMYKPNKTVTVKDIGSIIDDFEKAGKEVVFLCVDYLKRIKPSASTKELRLDLGNIADELHVLALEKEIPIFTAMQLNRVAIGEIDNAETFEQKLSAFNRIGISNTGESIDIPQNVDLSFTMFRTVKVKTDEQGNIESIDKFLSFKFLAARYNISDIDHFMHRFKQGNDMALEEDADSKDSVSILDTRSVCESTNIMVPQNAKGARHPR